MNNHIIQGLWIGESLGVMEQLSINSYLFHGHEYHLYIYDEMKNVPKGALLQDANKILPYSAVERFSCLANFSDYFRYCLLLEKGNWWVDLDTVCLKPFDFPGEYVFSAVDYSDSFAHLENSHFINGAYVKAPKGSDFLGYLKFHCEHPEALSALYIEFGPKLLSNTVNRFQLHQHIREPIVFNPIPFQYWSRIINPNYTIQFSDETYAVHLWNNKWRLEKVDQNAEFHPDCLYEQLKSKYFKHV